MIDGIVTFGQGFLLLGFIVFVGIAALAVFDILMRWFK